MSIRWVLATILVFYSTAAAVAAAGDGDEKVVRVVARGQVVLDAAPDHLISPCVLLDGDVFHMWYARTHFFAEDDPLFEEMPWLRGERHTWFIEHATSTDGINWSEGRRVLGPGVVARMRLTQVHQPCVIKEAGGYRMWFNGREKGSNLYRLFHSRSSDGIDWEPPSLAMDLGPAQSLYDRSVGSASVLRRQQGYRMWFGGMSSRDDKSRTLYAESPDGLTWSEPVLAVDTGSEGAPDSRRAYRPCVIAQEGHLLMLYCAIGDDSLAGPYVTMLANSTDGGTWKKHGVALDVGGPEAPDALRCYDAWGLPERPQTLRVWYVGKAADGFRRICHARLEMPPER